MSKKIPGKTRKEVKSIGIVLSVCLTLLFLVILTLSVNKISLSSFFTNLAAVVEVSFFGMPATPSIVTISPATSLNNQTVAVTVTGQDFGSGYSPVRLKLSKSGQVDIEATNVVVASSTELTADFNLIGKVVGTWNLVVSNYVEDVEVVFVKNNIFTITEPLTVIVAPPPPAPSLGNNPEASFIVTQPRVALADTAKPALSPAIVPASAPAVSTVAVASPVPAFTFTKLLTVNDKSSDVKKLQQFLNSDPATMISSKGTGSPGNETEYFGSLTKEALGKFQLKYHIVESKKDAGYGSLGPKTRAKIDELNKAKVLTAEAATVTTTTIAPIVVANKAETISRVSQLQSLLDKLLQLMGLLKKLK